MDETRRWRGRCVIVREIETATRFRAATFTRTIPPFHKIPNTTPIGLFPTTTINGKKGVMTYRRTFLLWTLVPDSPGFMTCIQELSNHSALQAATMIGCGSPYVTTIRNRRDPKEPLVGSAKNKNATAHAIDGHGLRNRAKSEGSVAVASLKLLKQSSLCPFSN